MSVLDNVAFGLRMRGVPRVRRREQARAALDLVGLGALALRKPDALSGGQRQRTALARAIVLEPSVLLLDEPLGALDQELRRQMQDELKALQRRVGATFVHVTHDQEEALALADLLVVMRAGRIEDQGPPQRVYLRPATRFVASFLGDADIVEGRVAAHGIDTAFGTVPLSVEGPVGRAVDLVIRPEQLRLGTPLSTAWDLGDAVLGETVFLGGFRRGVLRFAGGGELAVKLPPVGGPETGATVRVSVAPSDVVVLSR
jgi:spermidine/putrescine transport system ATP-binding protein